jgi:hypothetical protein
MLPHAGPGFRGQSQPRDVPSGKQAGVAVLFLTKHIAVRNAVFQIVR